MKKIESTKCNKCISSGGGDCATCDPPGTTAQQELGFTIMGSELDTLVHAPIGKYLDIIHVVRSRPHNPAPQENQILVTFKDKSTVDYILLVSRRKGYDLGDYIEGNFEWDDMLPCIDKINSEDCQFCDFREQCPDHVGGAQ